MMRKLPPVGTALRMSELLAALRAGPSAEDELARALQDRVPGSQVFLFGSGRAALAALLTAMKQLRQRRGVIVPAYTCWSVPAATVRAGLRVLPAEMTVEAIDYDAERLERLDWSDVLAVISPNLFGLPGNLARLRNLADAHGAFLIDDAAQALGASVDGAAVGGFGAAGICSFGRGKNITALGGGAALVRHVELAEKMRAAGDLLRSEPPPGPWRVAGKGAAMRAALSPRLFDLAENLPGARIGVTIYEPRFSTPAIGAARAALAVRVLQRLETLNQQRAQIVELLDRALREIDALILPKPRHDAAPAWLRRPVLVPPERRDELLAALQAAGIGATAMYPAPIHQIPRLAPDLDMRGAPFPGAERLAASLIALPLVEGLRSEDIETIGRVMRKLLGRRRTNR